MIRLRTRASFSLAIGLLGAATIAIAPGCGDSGSSPAGYPPDNNNGDDDSGTNPGKPGKDGGKPPHGGDAGQGDDDSGIQPPPVTCGGNSDDATATPLDFTNNQLASPSPPGGLDPRNAPQIVVFGWDDVESQAGITFVNQLLGSILNPNGTKGGANLNPNACYGEGWGAQGTKYVCGDGTLANDRADVTVNKFDMGNHTIDHLESNSTWTGIPTDQKDPSTNSWLFTADGMGPGVSMNDADWHTVLSANDSELKTLYGVATVGGFRAPRLEINDHGLKAIKAMGYQYDEDLEELLPPGYVDAAIAVDTGSNKGFNWIPWPYTLDNGSPGIWVQQSGGDKKYVVDYPTGVWEVPVYQAYIPSKDGLGTTIANDMMKADDPSSCTFPAGTPADQQQHCYLSDGELHPGDSLKEVTAFDFNTFVYSRMRPEEWLATMKHTFLLRYYGNRAPLTYGAHPVEYTDPYDSYTLTQQANNYGYRNVLDYSTYTTRQQAMTDFVNWIKNDPTLSKDTYFMSAAQLVAYMKQPFDKNGTAAPAETVATPDSNGLFTRLGWTGNGATLTAVDGNTADIVFNVASVDEVVSVGAGLTAGALKDVSHIDIKYTSEVPFRIRLITANGTLSTTVLLGGTTGDRLARIRIKDFFPGPEATAPQVAAAALVDGNYMGKVSGIAFESAQTQVTGAKTFHTHIEQITLHGVATSSLCSP